MRRILAVAFAAVLCTFAVTGCAQLQKVETLFFVATGNVVPPQKVLIAINAFDAAEALGTIYLKRPVCATPVLCRDRAISASVIKWIRAGRVDRNALKAAVRANPDKNLSLVDVYNDLDATTSALTSAIAGK